MRLAKIYDGPGKNEMERYNARDINNRDSM